MAELSLLSPLFVPADRPERFAKAAASGAGAIIVDLEDAVAPDAKAGARANLGHLPVDACPVLVRINSRASGWFEDDLAAVAASAAHGVVLPKAEEAADIAALRALGEARAIVPLIETARGLAQLSSVLAAPGVTAAAFGSLDLALDLGCEHTWEALLMARSELVLRSRLVGLPAPVDGVTTALDEESAAADARRAAALGFGGKLAIHPRQVAPIQAAFRPSEADIVWARRVIAATRTGAAVRLDGAMIDAPLVARARRILAASGG
ncbi:HpcH/HpaI aldolase/citrate lyase family protein [Chelatococcus composti]|uniref:Citrate lyase subunit beta/citryl-CoA lyase n=1 Tax=Chelatococcus composti TaxID=1743235 RepID=A0A841KB64_9HYPH|nr:CoA ester lyase [Chelatococcus composti]MBB6168652.1 citrate lyase subunit beta/citryl-CoA lyase [Chelatococcus composti]MBS7737262.1 CoA ester lyase [Chelatococcus composti]PZN44314.1 MAG: CoA ester lyase [Pseudomonadota bacterium]GGG41719.1 citryl-CoA lyase [Chelatococcus composti]